MMKKNGFTLAEVLITLAIIGVVATLTLPSLMANTSEQQAVTGFRKAMNTLNEAGQMNAALEGFDYGQLDSAETPRSTGATFDSNDVPTMSLWSLLATRAQVDAGASVKGGIGGACNGLSQIIFRDGTALCYAPNSAVPAGVTNTAIHVWIDTNGVKAPNQVSTCGGEASCPKRSRTIKDQFPVSLKGSIAIPGHVSVTSNGGIQERTNGEDYAAAWAMRK